MIFYFVLLKHFVVLLLLYFINIYYCVCLCVRACMYVWLGAHECRFFQAKGVRLPGVEITGDCKPPEPGSGNQNQVLWKSGIYS